MENQRGKDTGMQDNPTIPTLSDQKKPPFPIESKAHPQTTREKEEQTFSLLSKGESPPSPTGNDVSLSLLLKKSQLPKSQKDSPPQKAMLHFPYCQKNSLPYRRKNNVSLPTAENKTTPR